MSYLKLFYGSLQVSWYNQPKKVRVSTLPNAYATPHSGLNIFAKIVDTIKIIKTETNKSFIGRLSVLKELFIYLF